MLRRSITQTTAFLLSPQTHAYTAAQNNFSLNKLLSFVSPRMSQIQISNALCSNRLYSRLSRAAAGPIQHQRLAALHNSTPWPQQHNMQLPFVPQWRSRQQTCSWQLKAELSGGGGGSSGSGGKKGYSSSGDGAAGDGSLWGAYNRLLETHPLLVKAITTAILSAIGNLICQVLIEKKPELDMRRLSTFTVLGLLWVAPCLHFWYGTLNRLVTATGNTGALMRMACDQLGFAPLFIGSMIAILTALDGKADRVVDTLKADLPSAITANWMLWVPAQFVNFRFVPQSYQVLFSNLVAVAWNVYFSWATRPKQAAAV